MAKSSMITNGLGGMSRQLGQIQVESLGGQPRSKPIRPAQTLPARSLVFDVPTEASDFPHPKSIVTIRWLVRFKFSASTKKRCW
jgi:hypothetical protein